MSNRPDFCRLSVLVFEFAMIGFLCWALARDRLGTAPPQLPKELSESRISFSAIANPHPEEEPMLRRYPMADVLHTEVHIDLCPNDSLHITIGNICLHLCQQDFLQLAQAVLEATEQIPRCQSDQRDGTSSTK